MKTLRSQATVNLAIAACALERYKLANAHYPETLATLTPQFVATVPRDPVDGQPLRYRLTADRQYVLYSIGTDGRTSRERLFSIRPAPGWTPTGAIFAGR